MSALRYVFLYMSDDLIYDSIYRPLSFTRASVHGGINLRAPHGLLMHCRVSRLFYVSVKKEQGLCASVEGCKVSV